MTTDDVIMMVLASEDFDSLKRRLKFRWEYEQDLLAKKLELDARKMAIRSMVEEAERLNLP